MGPEWTVPDRLIPPSLTAVFATSLPGDLATQILAIRPNYIHTTQITPKHLIFQIIFGDFEQENSNKTVTHDSWGWDWDK